MMAAQTKRKSTLVRAKTPAKVRVVVSPATTVAKVRTPAKARVVAQPMDPNRLPIANAPQPQWVGVELPDPFFSRKILICQQILSMDSQTSELG